MQTRYYVRFPDPENGSYDIVECGESDKLVTVVTLSNCAESTVWQVRDAMNAADRMALADRP